MVRPRCTVLALCASVPFQITLLAIMSRLTLAFVGWYTLKLIPPPWGGGHRSILAWAQWDGAHYARIALNGYDHLTDPGSPAFFPLYPMIVRLVARVLGRGENAEDMLVVGVLVASVFFVAAVWFLVRLFELCVGPEVARTAGVLLCVSPYSFFLSAAYTESLFLLLVALVFLLGRREKWLRASVMVALGTASRVPGVFLIPALLLMAWKRGASWQDLVKITLISPLGILSYMAYTWWSLGDPLAFLHAQSGWGGFQERTWNYVQGFVVNPPAWFLGDNGSPIMFLNFVLFVIFLLTIVPMARLLPAEVTLFSTLVILQTAFSLQSLGRYLIPAIGTYLVGAILIHRFRCPALLRDAIVILSAVLMTALFLLFAEAEWVV